MERIGLKKIQGKAENGFAELDMLDVGIIKELQANARTSYRRIARKFDVSVTTVSERVGRMVKSGLIRSFTVIVDPEKSGPVLCAALYIRIENGSDPKEVGRRVSGVKGICYTYQTVGLYDIIALGSSLTKHDFAAMLREVGAIRGIKEVVPSMVLDTIKEDPRHPVSVPEN